ncbi:amidohydrolase family protein [Streptomyces sp. NPDC048445]|uniref:amidohydrolase family protein n=1 Tax=Streptomyces sp. NPDC048445 TaxID=3365553 RepID=UPI00371D2E61
MTVVKDKIVEYGREPAFLDAAAAVRRSAGENAGPILQRLAAITFKPEAVVGRRIPQALAFMRRHGFRPVAYRRVRLDQRRAHTLWRFQWNVATADRLAVADLLMPACDSLWVAFWDETTPLATPGTVRFRSLKGPAYPSVRKEGQLRYELGGTNRMMTFIHAADEPIDLIRELGTLFAPEALPTLARALSIAEGVDATANLHRFLSALHTDVPSQDLDIDAVMRRLDALITRRLTHAPSFEFRAVRDTLSRARSGQVLNWAALERELDQAGLDLPLWDRIQIGAQYIRHDRENTVCTIDEDGRSGWLSGRGAILPLQQSQSLEVNETDTPAKIVGVTVVDVVAGRLQPGMTLHLKNGRLAPDSWSSGSGNSAGDERTVIDGSDLFLCPGLYDGHVHHQCEDDALYLANGVTHVRNMWGDERALARAAGNHETASGPRLVTTSPVIDGPADSQASTWPGVVVCQSKGDGVSAATKLADVGYRILKIYGNLGRAMVTEVCQVAEERDLLVVGHCPGSLTFEEAAGLGVSCIEHLDNVEKGHLIPEYALALKSLGRRSRQLGPAWTAVEALRLRNNGIDWVALGRMADELASAGTAVCPTLSVYRMMFQDPEAALRDPALKHLARDRIQQWHPRYDFRLRDLVPVWPEIVALSRQRLENYLQIVALLHSRGVQIIAGTDAPNPYLVPGFSLHQELSLLVQAGLSPLDALRCATTAPAERFGLGPAHQGSGASNGFLLVDANPMQSLRTLRTPRGLVVNGAYLDHRALTALLDDRTRAATEVIK